MEKIGIILSESDTKEASCQLLESAEKGQVYEAMLVLVHRAHPEARILARISQVVPYNDFYTHGDAWSESRRKDVDIPSDVARRWEICKLDLLRDLSPSSGSLSFPPSPGDGVFKLDLETNRKEVFDIGDSEEGIVWIGSLRGYPENVMLPLDVEQIPMHLAIFGVTGSGKSFTTGVLIEKLLDIKAKDAGAGGYRAISYPMLIVDAHGDYSDYITAADAADRDGNYCDWCGAASWFRRYVFPRSQALSDSVSKSTRPIGIDLDLLNPGEVANLVVEYYKGDTSTSILQVAGLARVLDSLEAEGYKLTSLFQSPRVLRERLDEIPDRQIHSSSKAAINRAIDHFHNKMEYEHDLLSTGSDFTREEFVDELTQQRGVAIVDFSADGAPGIDLPTKQFVMTYLAKVLYNQFSIFKQQGMMRYLLFMIEEAQNFCPSSTYEAGQTMSHSTLQAIATQGRKFGLSLCLISQRPSFLDKVIISMCNSFLIHRVSPEDVGFVKKVTGGLPVSLANRLTNLARGEVIVHGQMTTIPFPMLIRIPKSQRSVDHIAGTTRVVQGIAEASNIEL